MTLAEIRQWYRTRGPLDSLRQWIASIRSRVFRPEQGKHPFDRTHGVNTSGLLYANALATGHPNDVYSEGYYATAPSLFHGAMALWQKSLYSLTMADYTFVDLGCGKGRALLMASDSPFHKILGVELNAKLAAVARRNVTRWIRSRRACRTASVVEGDVLELPIPDGPVVMFLFNSFEMEMVRGLLERLVEAARTRTAPIDLVYIHPEHDNLVRQTAGVEKLADEDVPFTTEDAAADAFGVNVDQCCVYRFAGRLQ